MLTRAIEVWKEYGTDEIVFRVSGSMLWQYGGNWSRPVQIRFVRMPSGMYELEMRDAE